MYTSSVEEKSMCAWLACGREQKVNIQLVVRKLYKLYASNHTYLVQYVAKCVHLYYTIFIVYMHHIMYTQYTY